MRVSIRFVSLVFLGFFLTGVLFSPSLLASCGDPEDPLEVQYRDKQLAEVVVTFDEGGDTVTEVNPGWLKSESFFKGEFRGGNTALFKDFIDSKPTKSQLLQVTQTFLQAVQKLCRPTVPHQDPWDDPQAYWVKTDACGYSHFVLSSFSYNAHTPGGAPGIIKGHLEALLQVFVEKQQEDLAVEMHQQLGESEPYSQSPNFGYPNSAALLLQVELQQKAFLQELCQIADKFDSVLPSAPCFESVLSAVEKERQLTASAVAARMPMPVFRTESLLGDGNHGGGVVVPWSPAVQRSKRVFTSQSLGLEGRQHRSSSEDSYSGSTLSSGVQLFNSTSFFIDQEEGFADDEHSDSDSSAEGDNDGVSEVVVNVEHRDSDDDPFDSHPESDEFYDSHPQGGVVDFVRRGFERLTGISL